MGVLVDMMQHAAPMMQALEPTVAAVREAIHPHISAHLPEVTAALGLTSDDESERCIALVFVFIGPILLLLLLLKVLFAGKSKAGTTVTGGKSAGKKAAGRRDVCLLCGPCGAGKTAMFQALVGMPPRATHTSMTANRGTAAGQTRAGTAFSFPIVDAPGHPRLRTHVFEEAKNAKCVILMIDAVAATEDDAGVRPAVPLLAHFFDHPNPKACLVIAANKRDDISSYSSKALRKMLETELTAHYVAKTQSVGRAKVMGATAAPAKDAKAAAVNNEIVLEEGERFDFTAMADSLGLTLKFIDVSAVKNETKFSFDPIVDAMLM